jgi:starch synthase
LQICSVSAEHAPWSKTGGLGDVAAALPPALAARGHRVLCVSPRYKPWPEAWDTGLRLRFPLFGAVQEVGLFHHQAHGVDLLFVDHPAICRGGIYGDDRGGYGDNLFRFALLCRAAIEAARRFPLTANGGGPPLADAGPLRFLTHDWHAGLLPVYLRAHYQAHGLLRDARVVHVIHNLAHQGQFSFQDWWGLDLADRWAPTLDMGGVMNCMKAALVSADKVCAVSPSYAREITDPSQGFGLDGILRARGADLTGVVNGIDPLEWDPRADRHLPQTYGPEALGEGPRPGPTGGKAATKAALQAELGLPVRADLPLLGFIGRLTGQKGIDLLEAVGPWLARQPAQLCLLGTGEPRYEAVFRELAARHPRAIAARVGFDVGLAHRITGGSDILLMPSRFEPCGLNQLYALAYGTVPVVHATGGLRDTVRSFDPGADQGTGWAFSPADAGAFQQAITFALETWHRWPQSFRAMARRGMAEDHGWVASAAAYEALLDGHP